MSLEKHYKELYSTLFSSFQNNWVSFLIQKCFDYLANKKEFIQNNLNLELQAILIEFLYLSFPKRMDENLFNSQMRSAKHLKEANFELDAQNNERVLQLQYLVNLTWDYDTYQKQIFEIERILKYVKSKWIGYCCIMTYEQKLILVVVLVMSYHTFPEQKGCEIDLELRNKVKFVIRNLTDQRDLFLVYHLQNLIEKIIEEIYFGDKESKNLEVSNIELIDTLRRQLNIKIVAKDNGFILLRKGRNNKFEEKLENLLRENFYKRKVIYISLTIV